MDALRLEIPQQSPNAGAVAYFNPGRLKAWLEALPLGNPAATGEELHKALQQVNRAEGPIGQRYHFLDQCRPLIADLLETLYKQYATAAVPLAEKQRGVADLTHGLLTEMASGYKAVILAASNTPNADGNRNMLIASVLYTMHYLARLLVDSYSLYAPEPKTLWLELHQIYRFAEKQGFLTTNFQPDAKGNRIGSVDNTYRRILMLALANPYHLMQGEALLVFKELEKWASTCQILMLAPDMSPKGHLFLDLEKDAPPRYAPARMNIAQPGDGRILNIADVLPVLEQRSKDLLISSKTDSGQLNMAGRKLRNMYKRLSEAWGVRTERMAERKQKATPVEISAGISACHHFASAGKEFNPEVTEIELRKITTETLNQGLSLTAENDTPWIKEDQAQRLNAGIVQPRVSQFDADPTKDNDIWVKVYSTQMHHEHKKNSDGGGQTFNSIVCQIRDESQGGMAISCKKAHGIRLVSGEIIGFKSEQSANSEDWRIGVVRWLRTSAHDKLDLGVRLLAEDSLPVAIRGVKGVGKDSEYFRSLLIPKTDPMLHPSTLITPASVYDVDSVVIVNTGTQLFHAHLTNLLDATNAFSLFQFQIVDGSQ